MDDFGGAPLGSHIHHRVAAVGDRVEIGAGGQEHRHHLRMVVEGRPVERGGRAKVAEVGQRVDTIGAISVQPCGNACRMTVGTQFGEGDAGINPAIPRRHQEIKLKVRAVKVVVGVLVGVPGVG